MDEVPITNDMLGDMTQALAAQTAVREGAAAENALIRHLALEGELALRRDQLAAEHQAVTQRLAEARGRREALVAAVQDAGGELPRWEV